MKLLTDEEKVIRGERAAELLDSEIFLGCMEEMYEGLHSGIDRLATDDAEAAMAIVRQIRAIKTLKVKLESWVQAAKLIRIAND